MTSVALAPSSTATTKTVAADGGEHRGEEQHPRLPDAVDDAAQHRRRHADAQPGGRGDDPDLRVVEARGAQQQDLREDVHPVRQPPDERGEHQRRDAGGAEQIAVAAQAHRPGSVRIAV